MNHYNGRTPIFAAPLATKKMKWLTILIIILAIIFFVFPVFWLIETAFKEQLDFISIPPKIFFKPTLKNFAAVLSKSDFPKAYKNSILISIFSVIFSLVIGVPVAYCLSRFRFRGRKPFSFWILSTRFIPPVVLVIPMFLIFRDLKLSNTLLGLILINMVGTQSMIIWIMISFFNGIPFDIEEAACVDGASPITTFTRVALPLVGPGVVSTAILSLISSWNELLFATILGGKNTRTLPVVIYNFVSYDEVAWGQLCAAAVLAIAPVVIFSIIVQKHLISGLTLGAVK